MKKIIIIAGLLISLLIVWNGKATAAEIQTKENSILLFSQKEKQDDGYVIIETYEKTNESNVSLLSNSYSKHGERIVTKYDTKDKVQWIYVLSAEYWIEEGDSVICYKADYSTTIKNSLWKFSEGSTSYSGNEAYGKGKFTYKVLWLFSVQNTYIDIHLACDAYGNLS
ncbi:MAG: hypothetical protein K2I42_05565 [Anaeroplasmataceae bacterium]|nr:hypothetical protein [Anaeroplasmataceae bacterium]